MVEGVRVPVPPRFVAEHPHDAQTFSPDLLRTEPVLAALVGEVIAWFAQVDAFYEAMISVTMPREAAGAKVLLARIKDGGQRRSVIRDLLAEGVRSRDRPLLRDLDKAIKPVRDIRNSFAHGLWGISWGTGDFVGLKRHDGLLLMDSAVHNRRQALKTQGVAYIATVQPAMEFLRGLIYVPGSESEFSDKLASEDRTQAVKLLEDLQAGIYKRGMPEAADDWRAPGNAYQGTVVWTQGDAEAAVLAAEACSRTARAALLCLQVDSDRTRAARAAIAGGKLLPVHFDNYLW